MATLDRASMTALRVQHASHVRLTNAVGQLLLRDHASEPFLKSVQEAATSLSEVCTVASECSVQHLPKLEWEALVLFARMLDRSLALTALANAVLADVCQPFSALLLDGSRTMCELLRAMDEKLKRMRSPRSRAFSLRGSGPILDAAKSRHADFSSLYSFGDVSPKLRHRMMLGVAGDCLDLADEVAMFLAGRGIPPPTSPRDRALTSWTAVAGRDRVPRRVEWACGDLLGGGEFAVRIGVSEAALDEFRRERSVLGVRGWDGTYLYPEVQLIPLTGPHATAAYRLPHRLGDLLRANVDFGRCAPLALAIWLGTKYDHKKRIRFLDDEQGLGEICATLHELGALRGDARNKPYAPQAAIPSRRDLRGLRNAGTWTSIRGSGSHFEERWMLGSAPDPSQPVLHRLTKRDHGAFNFTSANGHGPDAGSRFDLRVPGSGTCYFSDSAAGAFFEVFARLAVLDVQECAMYALWKLTPFEDQDRLLDISSGSDAAASLGLGLEVSYTRKREATQRLATTAQKVGFNGIVHTIRSHQDSRGYALFARSGAEAPELSGLGSWSVRRYRTTEGDSDFWAWLSTMAPKKNMTPVFNQLPIKNVFRPD